VVVIGNTMVGGVVKGVQRDFPLAGVWGCHHPAVFKVFIRQFFKVFIRLDRMIQEVC
jgi:hypothetical protein